MNRPFQSRLRIDYSTNNHFSQLRSTDHPDRYFVAILLWRKPPGPRIMRKLQSTRVSVRRVRRRKTRRTALIPRVLNLCLEKQLGRAIHRILCLHHETMMSVSLDEPWSFRTKISGSDLQIYPCTFLSFRLFVSCTSKHIAEGHLRIWKPRTKPSRRLRKKSDQTHRDTIWQSQSYWQ